MAHFVKGKEVVVLSQQGAFSVVRNIADPEDMAKEFSILTSKIQWKEPKAVKPRQAMREWIDPQTGVQHTCPERYMRVKELLNTGVQGAQKADTLLELLGEDSKRHLRKATEMLRSEGLFVVSNRSSSDEGGYFIATTDEEMESYIDMQIKLGQSMIDKAGSLLAAWKSR